jgi:hypothetical protein
VVVARNPFWQRGKGNPQPKNVIPIAEPKFTKNPVDDPLLQVPPASRGNRTPARFPSRSGGNLKEGGNCELWLCSWYKTDLRAGLSVRRGRTAANLAATGMTRETTQVGGGLLPTALPKFVDAQDSNPPSPRPSPPLTMGERAGSGGILHAFGVALHADAGYTLCRGDEHAESSLGRAHRG